MKEVMKFLNDEERELVNNIETYMLLNGYWLESFEISKRDKNFFIMPEEDQDWKYKVYRYKYRFRNQEFNILWIEYIINNCLKFDCIRLVYRESRKYFHPTKFFYSIDKFKDFIVNLL